jgi:hypothetical protein
MSPKQIKYQKGARGFLNVVNLITHASIDFANKLCNSGNI